MDFVAVVDQAIVLLRQRGLCLGQPKRHRHDPIQLKGGGQFGAVSAIGTFHRIPTQMPLQAVFMRGGAGPACMDD